MTAGRPLILRRNLDSPSAVCHRVAVRLHDYLADADLSRSAFWPLADRLTGLVATSIALEQRRVQLCLSWAQDIVVPASSAFLTSMLGAESSLRMLNAGRAVNHELSRALHVAPLESLQARDLAVSYVWNAVFAAFTVGHTRPLMPAVSAVLTSGHELLDRLLDLADASDDAALAQWTPVWLTLSPGASHADAR